LSFAPDSTLVNVFEPSPNFGPRRSGYDVADMLILHYTGMESAASAIDWLTRPESSVSAHYLVDEAGQITQMVMEEKRAWHAGVSHWAGEEDINSCSIGIEIHNPGIELGYPDFPVPQIEAVTALCKDICFRLKIVPKRVLAHSDVAPTRKPDPGEKFPWHYLHRNGVGIWAPDVAITDGAISDGPTSDGSVLTVGDRGEDVSLLQTRLKALGYRMDVSGEYCKLTEQVVTAFQRHWRRALVDGRADRSTVATLERVLALALGHRVT